MIEEHASITAADAQRYLGLPASTIRAAANPRPGKEPTLYAVGTTRTGAHLYPLRAILELLHTTQRRTPHTRVRRSPACTPATTPVVSPI